MSTRYIARSLSTTRRGPALAALAGGPGVEEGGLVSHPEHHGAHVRLVEQAGAGDDLGQAAEDLGGQVAEQAGPGADDDPGDLRLAGQPAVTGQGSPQRPGFQAGRDLGASRV